MYLPCLSMYVLYVPYILLVCFPTVVRKSVPLHIGSLTVAGTHRGSSRASSVPFSDGGTPYVVRDTVPLPDVSLTLCIELQ